MNSNYQRYTSSSLPLGEWGERNLRDFSLNAGINRQTVGRASGITMPALKNPRHEAFAQALARGLSASAAYVETGYKANRHNAAALAREEHIKTRVTELQEEQLAIHQQATAAAAANKQVTIESLIAEAEAARAKAMSEKGGAAAAVSALTAKAKLAGMWREKVDQHNTGTGTVSTVWSVSWDEEVEQSDGREAG
jgi:hypothetical protein